MNSNWDRDPNLQCDCDGSCMVHVEYHNNIAYSHSHKGTCPSWTIQLITAHGIFCIAIWRLTYSIGRFRGVCGISTWHSEPISASRQCSMHPLSSITPFRISCYFATPRRAFTALGFVLGTIGAGADARIVMLFSPTPLNIVPFILTPLTKPARFFVATATAVSIAVSTASAFAVGSTCFSFLPTSHVKFKFDGILVPALLIFRTWTFVEKRHIHV